MKFLWLVFWDPARAFDWSDAEGSIDHGKVGTFLFAWAVLVSFVVFNRLLPLGHTIAIMAALFGSRTFIAFLKSKAATAEERRIVVEGPAYGPRTEGMDG